VRNKTAIKIVISALEDDIGSQGLEVIGKNTEILRNGDKVEKGNRV
jgi:hypothetical protein